MSYFRSLMRIVLLAVTLAHAPEVWSEDAACSSMEAGTYQLTDDHQYRVLHRNHPGKAILIKLESYKLSPTDDVKHGSIEVNSDGSPRAYHLLDPEGKEFALNDMYSGGVRIYLDGEELKPGKTDHRYYDTFRTMVDDYRDRFGAKPSIYNAARDKSYKLGGDFGLRLDEPRELTHFYRHHYNLEGEENEKTSRPPLVAGDYLTYQCTNINCKVQFPNNIFRFPKGELCIRKNGRYAGFLVNRLAVDALQPVGAGNPADPENAEDSECDVPVNVDAEKLPGFVLPGNGLEVEGAGKMALGDIVVAYSSRKRTWVFGIISDTGPTGNRFGEASIDFNRILKGGGYVDNVLPRPEKYTKASKNDASPKVTSLSISSEVYLLLLPGTATEFKKGDRANGKYDFSPETIASFGKAAFLKWAAAENLSGARSIFRSCVTKLEAE